MVESVKITFNKSKRGVQDVLFGQPSYRLFILTSQRRVGKYALIGAKWEGTSQYFKVSIKVCLKLEAWKKTATHQTCLSRKHLI